MPDQNVAFFGQVPATTAAPDRSRGWITSVTVHTPVRTATSTSTSTRAGAELACHHDTAEHTKHGHRCLFAQRLPSSRLSTSWGRSPAAVPDKSRLSSGVPAHRRRPPGCNTKPEQCQRRRRTRTAGRCRRTQRAITLISEQALYSGRLVKSPAGGAAPGAKAGL